MVTVLVGRCNVLFNRKRQRLFICRVAGRLRCAKQWTDTNVREVILVFLWHGDLDVDGVRADIADNAVMRFNVTILVDGGSDVIVLVRLGQEQGRHCSDMMLVMFGKMNGMTDFFNGI